jgi:hypothetical protein
MQQTETQWFPAGDEAKVKGALKVLILAARNGRFVGAMAVEVVHAANVKALAEHARIMHPTFFDAGQGFDGGLPSEG